MSTPTKKQQTEKKVELEVPVQDNFEDTAGDSGDKSNGKKSTGNAGDQTTKTNYTPGGGMTMRSGLKKTAEAQQRFVAGLGAAAKAGQEAYPMVKEFAVELHSAALQNELITWADPVKTGILVGVVNLFLVAQLFGFSLFGLIFDLVLGYGALAALIAGGALKLFGLKSGETATSSQSKLFDAASLEKFEKEPLKFLGEAFGLPSADVVVVFLEMAVKTTFAFADNLLKVVLPIVFWRNLETSACAAFVLYFCSGMIGSLFSFAFFFVNIFGVASASSALLCFLAFNCLMAYGKYHALVQKVAKEQYAKLAPQVVAAVKPQYEAAVKAVADLWAKVPRHEEKKGK